MGVVHNRYGRSTDRAMGVASQKYICSRDTGTGVVIQKYGRYTNILQGC